MNRTGSRSGPPNRARLALIAAPACVLALLPAAANACAVCFSGSARTRLAFFNTTILLSLLPLGMIVGGLWYLRRVGKIRLAEEFTESDYSVKAQDATVAPPPGLPPDLSPAPRA